MVLVVFLLSAAAGGYRLGLVARVGSWAGLLAGFVVGVRFGPDIADELSAGGGTLARFLITVLAVTLPAFVGQAIGLGIGSRLRRQVPRGASRQLDNVGGAAAGVLGFLVTVWLFLPVLGGVPGLAGAARESSILAFVDDVAPTPPASFRDLRTFVAQSPFPEVFTGMGRAPEASAPPAALSLPAAEVDRISSSTVNVEAVGCGRIQEGSGFVVGPGLIATNAHVVAGADSIEVLFPDGSRAETQLVAFDDGRDVAVLAGQFPAPPLPLADTGAGTEVAIFGHPDGQDPLRVAPGVISRQITATGRDIYGRDRVQRQIYVVGARIRQGDSGSALVDAAGQVVGQAFAVAPDRPGTAYALTASEVGAVVATAGTQPVDSGACQTR